MRKQCIPDRLSVWPGIEVNKTCMYMLKLWYLEVYGERPWQPAVPATQVVEYSHWVVPAQQQHTVVITNTTFTLQDHLHCHAENSLKKRVFI